MSRKPDPRRTRVIRRNDKVRIVVPEFFVRCGYPKSIESEAAVVLEKFGAIIRGMIHDPEKKGIFLCNYQGLVDKVCREVAYARLRANGFGGTQRTIHAKRQEDLLGKEFFVRAVKYHKTGTYCPPYGMGDEYEPGFLDHEKTNKILFLSEVAAFPSSRRTASRKFLSLETDLAIEAANVEKVMLPVLTPDYPSEE